MTLNKIFLENLTETEKGYIIGLFIGDGYSYYDKKHRHYTIEFYLNSERNKKIQKQLIFLLEKIGLKCFVLKDKRFNCNRIRVYSKHLVNFLNSSVIRNCKIDFGIGYVSGIIDSEGYVNHEKSFVNVVSTNKDVLKNCKNILKKFKIEAKIRNRKKSSKDKKKSYILHISYKIKDIKLNSIKMNSGAMLSGDCL